MKISRISLEFPLTQAKRAWKIRRKEGRKKTPELKYTIEEGDMFEWMVTNEEVRDMVSALRCISHKDYERIKGLVYSISQFRDEGEETIGIGINLEARFIGKQRKPSELTPYLFVLLSLDTTTDDHYLVDKRGGKIARTLGYKLKAGDKLI